MARKPKILGDISVFDLIGYRPKYSLKNLLEELAKYGSKDLASPLSKVE